MARRLATPGFAVEADLPPPPIVLRELRRRPPAAIVISLDRLPAQGRDFAFALLSQKATAAVPIVLAGGAPAKVAAVRAKLPSAVYATWEDIGRALAQVLARPPDAVPPAPAATAGVMAGYSGTPLPKKLGLKPGLAVALLDAPVGFAFTLGALPPGALLSDRASAATGLALWFVRSRRELARGLARTVQLGARMPVWVVSPKKTGPLASDVSQNDIRAACLKRGLVDYKVCAVDSTWSGLLFRRRR